MSTKCAAFWHHTNVRSDNKVFACCRYKESVIDFTGDLSAILTSQAYEDLRRKVSNGEKLAGCSKCYHEESLGHKSLREEFNEAYDTDNVSLDFLEIGFNNVCDLTCDGCRGEFSHSWAKKSNPEQPVKLLIKKTSDIKDIPDTIKKVVFLSGEPLMTNNHKKFLKKITHLNELEVVYNTNGSFLLDTDTINLLNQCKHVKFIVSIDGYGALNEQVRSGSIWSNTINFLNQIMLLGYNLTVHSVIHLNNWHGFKDLAEFIRHNNYNWTVNVLTYPGHLYIARSEDKENIKKYIDEMDIPNKQLILNHLK